MSAFKVADELRRLSRQTLPASLAYRCFVNQRAGDCYTLKVSPGHSMGLGFIVSGYERQRINGVRAQGLLAVKMAVDLDFVTSVQYQEKRNQNPKIGWEYFFHVKRHAKWELPHWVSDDVVTLAREMVVPPQLYDAIQDAGGPSLKDSYSRREDWELGALSSVIRQAVGLLKGGLVY